jgi:RNA polymerase sigma-70 factor (ECF subfamily)
MKHFTNHTSRRGTPCQKGLTGVQFHRPPVQPLSQQQDAQPFESQVPRHLNAMLRVAAALVGMAEAEDTAQEALLRSWQAWPTLRDRDALRPWLLRITVNVCRDWCRGRFGTRRKLSEPLGDERGEKELAALHSDPGASDQMAALDLRQAINTLETHYRVVVLLRYYAGLDATEIGAALGLPAATVRTRLRRALAFLRQQLTTSDQRPTFRAQEGKDA